MLLGPVSAAADQEAARLIMAVRTQPLPRLWPHREKAGGKYPEHSLLSSADILPEDKGTRVVQTPWSMQHGRVGQIMAVEGHMEKAQPTRIDNKVENTCVLEMSHQS